MQMRKEKFTQKRKNHERIKQQKLELKEEEYLFALLFLFKL